MSMTDDRRKFRRIPMNLPASLEGVEQPGKPVQIDVVDISFGGLRLLAPSAIPPDTLVKLTLHRPPFEPTGTVVCLGRIRNSRQKSIPPSGQFYLNLAFEEMDSRLVQKILGWAQMQSFAQARARSRAPGGHMKARTSRSF